jgi:hypothetical protein
MTFAADYLRLDADDSVAVALIMSNISGVVAQVGPFLLLSGDTARYRDRVATILVRHLPPVIAAIQAVGGHILEGPAPAPNGDRLIARHPDGAVFEYIETGDQRL